MSEPCLFCDRTVHKILTENDFGYARLDNFPANSGHVEIVPRKHVDSWFDLPPAEQAKACRLLAQAKTLIVAEHGEPDAWTIGINDGRAAGRSIDHLHIHLIPRWEGDVKDPRGGIRQCAPNCDPDAWTKETR